MRRRASAKVQNTSAAQTTMSTRMRTLTAVFSASLLMPKTATVSMVRQSGYPRRRRALQEHAAESVAEPEEHEDRERDDERDERDHAEHARAAVVHSADALRAPGADSSSATR